MERANGASSTRRAGDCTLALPSFGVYWIGEDLILLGMADPDTGVETVMGHRLDRRGRT